MYFESQARGLFSHKGDELFELDALVSVSNELVQVDEEDQIDPYLVVFLPTIFFLFLLDKSAR